MNLQSYVTVITMDEPLGKLYYSNWADPDFDPNNPTINKSTPFPKGIGWATTVKCLTVNDLASVIAHVSTDHNKGIVLGYVEGTEAVDDSKTYGEPYRLVTQRIFADMFQELNPPYRKPKKHDDGILYATRTAQMFARSSWFAFDLDMSAHMPDELKKLIAEKPYIDLLENLCPQLIGVDYLSVGSSSSRVSLDGAAMSDANSHIYMQCEHTTDLERFSASLLLRSVGTPYGYVHPVIDIETGEIKPNLKGIPSSIFDKSVFSKARVMFEGSPQLLIHDELVVSGRLVVNPTPIVPVKRNSRVVDTVGFVNPTEEQQREARMYFGRGRGRGGFVVTNTTDLIPSTKIEVKDLITNETKIITAKDFVEGDVGRYRCQNPFKRESQSWSAFISKINEDGDPIKPYLHSVEFGNFEYNDTIDKFAEIVMNAPEKVEKVNSVDVPTLRAVPPPPPPVVVVDDTQLRDSESTEITDVGCYPDRVNPRNPLSLPKEVVEYNASRPDFNNANTLPVFAIPDDLVDQQIAKEFARRFFSKEQGELLPAGVGRGEYAHQWRGTHWSQIDKGQIHNHMIKCTTDVKGLSMGKVRSAVDLLIGQESTISRVPALPTSMIPMQNGVFDFKTGDFLSHDDVKGYFFTKIKDFEYDPNETGDDVLKTIIEAASGGNQDFIRQFKQMAGYLIAGGSNLAHKIFYFEGVPRAGKSLAARTISEITYDPLSIDIGRISDAKILNNGENKSLLIDDDAQTPSWERGTNITGTLKKLSAGDKFEIQQLYTTELNNVRLHPKILMVSNGMPRFRDPNGALHDRAIILPFVRSYTGKEDFSLESRLMEPIELSASFNYLLDGYLDLLKFNGYDSILEFEDSKHKSLQFFLCDDSKEALHKNLNAVLPVTKFLDTCSRCEGSTVSLESLISLANVMIIDKYANIDSTIEDALRRYDYKIENGMVIGIQPPSEWDRVTNDLPAAPER